MDPLEIMAAQHWFGIFFKTRLFSNCTTVNPFPSQQLIAITVLFFWFTHHLYDPLKTIQSGDMKRNSAHHSVLQELMWNGWTGALAILASSGMTAMAASFWFCETRRCSARGEEGYSNGLGWVTISFRVASPLSTLPKTYAILCACESFPCSGFAPRPLRGCRQDRS